MNPSTSSHAPPAGGKKRELFFGSVAQDIMDVRPEAFVAQQMAEVWDDLRKTCEDMEVDDWMWDDRKYFDLKTKGGL